MNESSDKNVVIHAAQIRQMYSTSNVTQITSLVLAAIFAYMLHEVVDSALVVEWFSSIVVVVCFRTVLAYFYKRSVRNENKATRFWLTGFRIGVLCSGVVWGSASFLLLPSGNIQYQAFIAAMLCGLAAGGLTSYSVDFLSGIVYIVSVLAPLIIRLFYEGSHLAVAMSLALLLYLWFMIMSLRYMNRNITENITMRIEAAEREKVLHRESEKNLALLHHASDGIHILDKEGNVIEASDSFCSLLGYQRDEVIGMNVSGWDAKFEGEELARLFGELFTQHGRSQFETLHRCKDQTILDVEVSSLPLELEGKTVLYCSSRDISSRKLVDAELRIAAASFESQEGILITDVNHSILKVNKAFSSITGYTPEEVVGKSPDLLGSGRHDEGFFAGMWDQLNMHGVWKGEIWNRRKNGEIYPAQLSITAVKNEHDSISNYVATFTDITLSMKAADEIRNLAFYDPLTKLPNRRLLLDRLQQALSSSARSGRQGALLFIDLDNFKSLNDTLGHDIGDLLLQEVAHRLGVCVRQDDSVGRLGGDEFVVLLENLGEHRNEAAEQTEAVANKILMELNQTYDLSSHKYHNTPSIGATVFKGYEFGVDQLFKQADIAMYQAKKAGRNTLRFFDPHMQEIINDRATIERELRNALDNNEFQLYYQIQVECTGDHRPFGAEALIRWIHSERGLISPADFIPIAEENGLIHTIGWWVLKTACAQIKAWQNEPHTCNLILSVNVSAKQFHKTNFVDQVKAAIQLYDINPKRLKLELTEGMLLDNIESTIATMSTLKDIGVGFSLDDFGTGYSSLSYLSRLPLDHLKIDRSFVMNMGTRDDSEAICSAIIKMAHSLKLKVVAEGVENETQTYILDALHQCNYLQGYLFGKPLPIDQFEALLIEKGMVSTF